MDCSAARRASTPSRLPIHTWGRPRCCRAVATARPGLVWPPVPPPAITIGPGAPVLLPRRVPVTLQGEIDEALHDVGIGEAGGLPHLGVTARRGEPRDGVDLVHEDRAGVVQEEIHPGHAGAVDRAERRD